MFFDMILKPVDNFWKKKLREAERKARWMETSYNCERGFHEAAENECIRLSDMTVKQSQAISRLERELNEKERQIEALQDHNNALQRELELTNMALSAERDARKVQQINSRLWSERRAIAITAHDSSK